jgi:copper chaperone CopZ
MTLPRRLLVTLPAAVAAAGAICLLCVGGAAEASARTIAAAQAPDTATVRLHISGMTCGSCPATARLALRKLPGVYSAAVTLDDSLGIVSYDRRRLTAAQIASHLTRMTGFRATVLPGQHRALSGPGGR